MRLVPIHNLKGFDKRQSQKDLRLWADFRYFESLEAFSDDYKGVPYYCVELQFATAYHDIRFRTKEDAEEFIQSVLAAAVEEITLQDFPSHKGKTLKAVRNH